MSEALGVSHSDITVLPNARMTDRELEQARRSSEGVDEWYRRPMRIAAVQCASGESDLAKVAQRWCDSAFNVEQIFHPMADNYSALYQKEKHALILADYLKELKQRDIRRIVYLNVHMLGPSLAKLTDEWAQRRHDGSIALLYEDSYPACCVNSPWRDYFHQSLSEVAEFDINGVFLDGPLFIAGGCHCLHCQQKFVRTYGREMSRNENLADFAHASLHGFLQDSYQAFKKIKPQAIFYMNLGVMHLTASNLRLPEALEYNDFVGSEGGFMFYEPAQNTSIAKVGLTARVLEAIAAEKPRIIFMAADHKPWSWYVHTSTETRLCLASASANGANVWYGLHGSLSLLDTPGGQACRKTTEFLARHEEYYTATRSIARVAVLFSLDTERNYRSSHEQTDFLEGTDNLKEGRKGNFIKALHGLSEILIELSVPFDVVTELNLASLDRYDLVFLPCAACLAPSSLSALQTCVKAGINLVSFLDCSLYDDRNTERSNFALAELLGVNFRGTRVDFKTHNYFVPGVDQPLWTDSTIGLLPAPSEVIEVEARPGAEVWAHFLKPSAGRYLPLNSEGTPAIVMNRYGKGRSLYFAGSFCEMASRWHFPEYRKIFDNIISEMSTREYRLESPAQNIEMVVRMQLSPSGRPRVLVHLINYQGNFPRPFADIIPQSNLRLISQGSAPSLGVRALVSECHCVIEAESTHFAVKLPPLREYEVLVFDY